MQTLDVKAQNPVIQPPISGTAEKHTGGKPALHGKTGAETARNGSSFLAMIEKMIAGTMDGKSDTLKVSSLKTAGRGAGHSVIVPGDENILNKLVSGKAEKPLSKAKTRPDALLAVQKGKISHKGNSNESTVSGNSPASAQPLALESDLKLSAKRIAEETAIDSASPETKLIGKKTKGTDTPSSEAALVLAGLQNVASAEKKALEKSSSPDSGEAEGKIARAERKDKKVLISVRDERSDGQAIPGSENSLTKSVQINDDGSADMTIGFRDSQFGSCVSTDTESHFMEKNDGKQGQSFASMLSSELRSNAADFVKTGSIVLRDNNAGLIRLTLHPESLGNVKISLEMIDKKITGKIIVSSQEAYDAFNENLDGLSDAFVQGGFESAGFDLSWTGQGSSGSGEEQGTISSPFYASSIPEVMSATDPADTEASGYRTNGRSAINVFA